MPYLKVFILFIIYEISKLWLLFCFAKATVRAANGNALV